MWERRESDGWLGEVGGDGWVYGGGKVAKIQGAEVGGVKA